MGSWQLFRLPRVTLPSFSQIGDGPETPSLDLLDPIKKHLLSISSDTAAMTCNATADEVVSEAPEWATSHLEAAAEIRQR